MPNPIELINYLKEAFAMFASKKITPLLTLSLFLSPSIAQSSHACVMPKNATLGVAITAAAIGAASVLWYARQPQDPEQASYDLYEFAEYLSLRYEVELALLHENPTISFYVSVKRTNQLDADIKKLETLIATAENYLSAKSAKSVYRYSNYWSLKRYLTIIHQKMITDPRYLRDVLSEWTIVYNRQPNWPAAQETAASNQSEHQEKPANETETAKPDNIVETRSGSFPNWELTHPAADL